MILAYSGETYEHVAFADYLRSKGVPFFHVPNDAKRSVGAALRLKAMGMSSGVPDIFISYPCGPWHGMFVEMKAKTGGRVSQEQREWIGTLNNLGYFAVVAYGAAEAIEFFEQYTAEEEEAPEEEKTEKTVNCFQS